MPDAGLAVVAPDGLVPVNSDALAQAAPDNSDPVECCCQASGTALYYALCPCQTYQSRPCAAPDAPCIFIDTRSRLSDSQLSLQEREAEGIFATWNSQNGTYVFSTIVQVNGVCYYLMSVFKYATDGVGGWPLPQGAVTIGGPSQVFERRQACDDSCAPLSPAGDCYELFPCDGCRGPFSGRQFVCARSVVGVSVVVFSTAESGAWCVNRSVAYTQAQAQSLGTVRTVNPLLIVADVGGRVGQLPAPACCFGVPIPQCRPTCSPPCATGVTWKLFPLGYAKVDVCCGRRDAFTYSVGFSYSKTITSAPRPSDGFVVVTTETGSIAGVEQDPTDCNYVIVTINQAQSNNAGFSDSSQFTVRVRKRCCLDNPETGVSNFGGFSNNTFVPYQYVYEPNGNTLGGFNYSRRTTWYGLSPEDSIRQGWFESGWGSVFQLSGPQPDADSYTSNGSTGGDCNTWSFNFSENQSWSDGRSQETTISLTITTSPSQGFPCGNNGNCGSGGWASFNPEDLVP